MRYYLATKKHKLEKLAPHIEALESEQRELYQTLADPAFYKQDSAEIIKAQDRLKSLEQELAEAYQRWKALEELNG